MAATKRRRTAIECRLIDWGHTLRRVWDPANGWPPKSWLYSGSGGRGVAWVDEQEFNDITAAVRLLKKTMPREGNVIWLMYAQNLPMRKVIERCDGMSKPAVYQSWRIGLAFVEARVL